MKQQARKNDHAPSKGFISASLAMVAEAPANAAQDDSYQETVIR